MSAAGAGGWGGWVCWCPKWSGQQLGFRGRKDRMATHKEDSCCEQDRHACYVDGDVCWIAVVCAILLFALASERSLGLYRRHYEDEVLLQVKDWHFGYSSSRRGVLRRRL